MLWRGREKEGKGSTSLGIRGKKSGAIVFSDIKRTQQMEQHNMDKLRNQQRKQFSDSRVEIHGFYKRTFQIFKAHTLVFSIT